MTINYKNLLLYELNGNTIEIIREVRIDWNALNIPCGYGHV